MADQSTVDAARERRLGLWAGIAGIATFLLTLAAVSLSARGAAPVSGDDGADERNLLLDLAARDTDQVLAAGARVLSLVLLGGFALYFYRAIRGRNDAHPAFVPWIGVAGFALVAAATVLSFAEVRDVARTFAESGSQTTLRANELLDTAREEAPLRVAGVAHALGSLLFGIWISLLSYEAMKVGLLTRFLGLFGIGAGIATVIGLPVGIALFLGWLVSLAILALGWWPGGRPPAWEEGRAVSWEEVDERQLTARRSLR